MSDLSAPADLGAPHKGKPTDRRLMDLFVAHLIRQLESGEVASATLAVIRQFLSDNSITLAQVRKGQFGEVAQRAMDDFPFDEEGRPRAASIM